tara:strand:+ start:417 stop:677 length:261 start_codon:yes stop_codon:yes gene_type:complete
MILILASYISVFVKAFQQRNVAFNDYLFVPIFSLAMAFTEVYIIINIVQLGASWDVVWKLATGAILGCWSAMYLHNKIRRKAGVVK